MDKMPTTTEELLNDIEKLKYRIEDLQRVNEAYFKTVVDLSDQVTAAHNLLRTLRDSLKASNNRNHWVDQIDKVLSHAWAHHVGFVRERLVKIRKYAYRLINSHWWHKCSDGGGECLAVSRAEFSNFEQVLAFEKQQAEEYSYELRLRIHDVRDLAHGLVNVHVANRASELLEQPMTPSEMEDVISFLGLRKEDEIKGPDPIKE